MAEYIEREAALRALEKMEKESEEGLTIEGAQFCIQSLPAVQVAPVKRGRWLLDHYEEYTAVMQCSKCWRKISVDPKYEDPAIVYPFCHCGARMDGEEEK